MNITAFFGIDNAVRNKLKAVEVFCIIYRLDKLIRKNYLRLSSIKKNIYIYIYAPKYFSLPKKELLPSDCKLLSINYK